MKARPAFSFFVTTFATLTIPRDKKLRLTLAHGQDVDFKQTRRATLALAAR
jgi:hypothetical protein